MSGGRHFKSAGSIFGNAESPKATKAPRISGSHFREMGLTPIFPVILALPMLAKGENTPIIGLDVL